MSSLISSTSSRALKMLRKLLTESKNGSVALLVIALMILYNRIGNQRDEGATNGIPGDRGMFPIVDESVAMFGNTKKFFKDRFQQYGPVFRSRIFGNNIVAVQDTQLSSFILCNDHLFAPKFFESAMKMFEGFMLVQGGLEHKRSRGLVVKALSDLQLKRNLKGIANKFDDELQRWKASSAPMEIYSAMKTAIMKVMMEILLGSSEMTDAEIDKFVHLFTVFGNGLAVLPLELPFTARGKGLKARAELLKWMEELVEARRKVPNAGANNRDLLQAMIEFTDPDTGLKADTDSIAKNGMVIVLAALDTTSSLVASALKLVHDYPEVLPKIQEECKQVWGTPDAMKELDDEEIYSRMGKMVYMDCFIQEALRVKAPALFTMRQAIDDVVIPGTDYIIPKGWFAAAAFAVPFENDQEAFPKPERFAPDRFIPQTGESASMSGFKGLFTPFGRGSHQCPGWRFAVAEAKIILSIMAMQNKWPELKQYGSPWFGAVDFYAPALETLGGAKYDFHHS